MYGPAVRSKKISTIRRWRSCINVSGLCLERRAPGHHGYQRACDLISGPASSRPFGSPVFACAGKTEPPFRLVLSQTSADNKLAKWSRHLKPVRLEGATASQHTPGDTRELVGKCDSKDVAMQSLPGCIQPSLESMTIPALRFDQHHPRGLHEQNTEVAVAPLRYLAEDSAVARGDLFGTRPSQAAKSRPLEKTSPAPIAATIALEIIGPMPGTLISRSQPASCRARTAISPDS